MIAANLRFAGRMQRLGTEGAFEVLARAKRLEAQGKRIIHLEIGEPDFPTAPHIIDAGVKALRDGLTHYSPSQGLAGLREAVAEDAGRRRGISIDPAEVVITPGAKPVFFFAMLALVNPGDEVLYPDPGFPVYESLIQFLDASPVPYALREDNDFDVAAPAILEKLTLRTRLVILNSPQNPSGGVMEASELRALASELARRSVWVFSDEIYSRLLFDGDHVSIARFFGDARERLIILDGFSKSYAMTGWRLGYGVMNPALASEMTRLMINSNSCTATFTQIAGIAALGGDQSCVDAMVSEFRKRRAVIVDGLNRIPGFRCRRARGAFYAFPNITGTGIDSGRLADALLNEAGVACLPGSAFGAAGKNYLRFSFANSIENIQEALARIDAWIRKNTPVEGKV